MQKYQDLQNIHQFLTLKQTNEEESLHKRVFSGSKYIHQKDLPYRWLHGTVIPAMMNVLLLFCAILLIRKTSKAVTNTMTTHRAILNSKLPHKSINNPKNTNVTSVALDYCVCVALPASPTTAARGLGLPELLHSPNVGPAAGASPYSLSFVVRRPTLTLWNE